jgi:hypothetical protein
MENKVMFKKLMSMAFALVAIGAHAAGGSGDSAQTGVGVFYARLSEVLLVLEMVKLPIVLPIWP